MLVYSCLRVFCIIYFFLDILKLIFVTWWVISGLGKGITAASIGRLLKSSWYSVGMIKMDPYLQVDAGTMSPYEHGEVFVTDDGGEIDLDFWHYERFVGVKLGKWNSITTWKVFQFVIEKERKWGYLGQTVQVIPHVINEIKAMIENVAQDTDVMIIEIGWTVWDIEWPHFIETMRQLRFDLWIENTFFVHVVPIITLSPSGEYKTKAIQHSIVKLREVWISPDCLVIRTPEELDETSIRKLSLFSWLTKDRIIQAKDQSTIYNVPIAFQEQWFTDIIVQHLFQKKPETDLSWWSSLVSHLISSSKSLTIWIAWKYTHFDDCYLSVIEALKHAWVALDTKIKIVWLDTCDYEDSNWEELLKQNIEKENIRALLVPWWFGKRGVEGMINVASYAMRNKIPYFGICLWMQVAVIAHSRYNCALLDANSSEFTDQSKNPVIHLMESQKNIENLGWTMRLGQYPAMLDTDSKTFQLYKQRHSARLDWNVAMERHRHRYEVNPQYHDILKEKWMIFSGLSPDWQLVEFIEIKNHPYFVATQAHPEFLSQLDYPHPLFVGLVEAGLKRLEDER